MIKSTFLFACILLTIITFGQTNEPELVSSAGDSFSNSIYRIDWSIGECVTSTHSVGDYIITQGFHQNIFVITVVEDLETNINISVYPNPTSDFITILNEKPTSVSIELIDINGKVLLQEKNTKTEKQLDFSPYTRGVYFLILKQEEKLIKSFKIIKN